MRTHLTIVGSSLLSILNGMKLEHHIDETTVYVRHVDSQLACDAFNAFASRDIYEFDADACACFYRPEKVREARCPSPLLNDPMVARECVEQC